MVVKQDETGFTWKAVPNLDEFKDDRRKEAEGMFGRDMGFLSGVGALKPNLQLEDFTEVGRILASALTPQYESRAGELAERVGAIVERYPLYEELSAGLPA